MGAHLGIPEESHSCHDITSRRRRNAHAYAHAIEAFRTSELPPAKPIRQLTGNGLKIVLRKRPLFDPERALGDFDVISRASEECEPSMIGTETAWVHKCGLRLDAKKMFVEHHGYPFHAVLDEKASTADLYHSAVRPLVQLAIRGGQSSVIMFGQTGSGKTYTTDGLLDLIAAEIFGASEQTGATGTGYLASLMQASEPAPSYLIQLVSQAVQCNAVSLVCLQVMGESVTDLLCDSGGAVTLREDADGATRLTGATTAAIQSAQSLLAAIHTAVDRRTQYKTAVHEAMELDSASSRSHALYCISTGRGTLVVTDLAGSEWAKDQGLHDQIRRDEAKAINSSLATLKRCIHARIHSDYMTNSTADHDAPTPWAPVRESKLTRLLAPALLDPAGACVLVATVSPAASHTEHAQDTLSLTCLRPSDTATNSVPEAAAWRTGGLRVVQSSVQGVAMLDLEDVVGAEAEGSTNLTDGCKEEDVEHPSNPRVWSSSQCCQWFEQAAVAALTAVQEAERDGSAARPLIKVTLSSKEHAEQCANCYGVKPKASLGLAFEKNSTTVGRLLSKGLVPAALKLQGRSAGKLVPGARLVRARGGFGIPAEASGAPAAEEVLGSLKKEVAAFKESAAAWEEWQAAIAARPKQLTQEMLLLRAYITGSNAVESMQEEAQTQQQCAEPEAVNVMPPPEPPPDRLLALEFEMPMMQRLDPPHVPKVFTGESRMGELWAGEELCDKYGKGEAGRKRFVVSCDGDIAIGNHIFQQLITLIDEHS